MDTAERHRRWRRVREEGAEWEARVTGGTEEEILEFVCLDGSRRPRRLAVDPGAYREMDDRQLRHAFLRARPIGGDHYGRPGKHMDDIG